MVHDTVPDTVLDLGNATSFLWLVSIKVFFDGENGPTEKSIYFCSNVSDLEVDVGDGEETWKAIPFEIGPLKETSDSGNYAGISMTIADPSGIATSWVRNNDNFVGRRGTLHLWHTDGSGGVVFSHPFVVTALGISSGGLQFTLGSRNFISQEFPGRRVYRDRCGFVFGGARCGYGTGATGAGSGTVGTCDYSLTGANGCQAKNNAARFGGFYFIP